MMEARSYRDRPEVAVRVREYGRAYYAEHRQEAITAARLRRDKLVSEDPRKARCWNAVAYALANGKLERQPCEVCGAADSQAHHPDYDRPLDVRWRCSLHHAGEHRKPRAA